MQMIELGYTQNPPYEFYFPANPCSHNLEMAGLINGFRSALATFAVQRDGYHTLLEDFRGAVLSLDQTVGDTNRLAACPDAARVSLIRNQASGRIGSLMGSIQETEGQIAQINVAIARDTGKDQAALQVIATHDAQYHVVPGAVCGITLDS